MTVGGVEPEPAMGGWAWVLWAAAGVMGVGALVLLGWALAWDRGRGRRRCAGCWYEMEGVPGLRCPECGREAAGERELLRRRRRWVWAGAAVVLMLLAGATGVTPKARRDGVGSLVPNAVLSLALPLYAEAADAAAASATGATTKAATRWERLLIAEGLRREWEGSSDPAAARLLGRAAEIGPSLGREIRPLVPELLRLVGSDDPASQWIAARLLCDPHVSASRAVPALAAVVQHENVRVRESALNSLVSYGDRARRAVPAIAAGAEEGRIPEHDAMLALRAIMARDGPGLRRMLRHESWVVRAAGTMGLMGKRDEAAAAAGEVAELLADVHPQVRSLAAWVLVEIALGGGDEARPAAGRLRQMAVEDEDANARRAGFWAASVVAPEDAEMMETAARVLRDPAPQLRLAAVVWLWKERDRALPLLAELESLREDDADERVRREAGKLVEALRARPEE